MLHDDIEHLAHPRFPQSSGAARMRRYLIRRLRQMGLTPVTQTFTRVIRHQSPTFTNVIGFPASGNLRHLLVVHSDSLLDYEGAVDAATCMAAALEICGRVPDTGVAFVDGEEAYPPYKWSADTAMSGSQHLVSSGVLKQDPEVVVVMDLWGGPWSSTFSVHQGATALQKKDYQALADWEKRLFPTSRRRLLTNRIRAIRTQDDSWPFLQDPVRFPRVVDLLATPFPPQWHRRGVDVAWNVTEGTVRRMTECLTAFLANKYPAT